MSIILPGTGIRVSRFGFLYVLGFCKADQIRFPLLAACHLDGKVGNKVCYIKGWVWVQMECCSRLVGSQQLRVDEHLRSSTRKSFSKTTGARAVSDSDATGDVSAISQNMKPAGTCGGSDVKGWDEFIFE